MAKTKTLSVNRALIELKTLSSRIDKGISEIKAIATVKNNAKEINGVAIDDYKASAKEKYESIQDLIDYKIALKKAVIRSNSESAITVGGKVYTIAEAIFMKNEMIEHMKALKASLASQLSSVQRQMAESERTLQYMFDDYSVKLFSGEKPSPEELEKHRELFNKSNGIKVIDPLGIEKEINELQDAIIGFTTDLDATIVECNATTEITVSW